MRTWIEINGKNSNSVNGLLVQSLPAITKPQMRVKTTTIDGRDGDIITRLGYSAYDRKFKIGLYGNYDINDVTRFFNQSGSVIFSNEPDMVYSFSMLKNIDYKKLVRFKTADVTMHVQPFKYSIKNSKLVFNIGSNLVNMPLFELTKAGVTVSTENDTIQVTGMPTRAIDLYIPIDPVKAKDVNYLLSFSAEGTGASSAYVKLIENAPTDAASFGGQYVNLVDGQTISLESALEGGKTFNYVWFYLQAGSALDFNFTVTLLDKSNCIQLLNGGNIGSKPVVTFYGAGDITFNFNDNGETFNLNLASDEYITIDSQGMNAYKGDTYKNRQFSGNFDYFYLKEGVNLLNFTGNVTKIEVENYSRFI